MTGHQASRAGHRGAEQAAPRCNIYDCPRDSTHTVQLPASTDTRLSPSARRAATVSLCRWCFTDWQQHTDPNRLRADVDLVRARPPTDADGMERLERDVRDLSLAQVALGEVELIQQYARYAGRDDWACLAAKLGNIGVIAARLHAGIVLLDERDAAAAEGEVKLELVRGPEGIAVYLNDTRIAGPKPWGGGRITLTRSIRRADLVAALKGAS